MIQQKLIQIGGIQTGEKDVFKFLTEDKKFQAIISRQVNSNKENINLIIEYDFEKGGEKVLNPAGFDFISKSDGEFLIFKNKEKTFKEIWSEIFTF